MATFYLTLLVLGVVVLAVQLVLGLIGVDSDGFLDDDGGGADGLDLFTVRALSAAAAAFGLVGLGLMQLGTPGLLALPFGLVAGGAAAVAVAKIMVTLGRLEQDKSFRIESALGLPATVALGIPGQRAGEGKIHLIAHERFQELNAVTTDADAIPSGSTVHVVDIVSSDTVVVARTPTLLEDSNEAR